MSDRAPRPTRTHAPPRAVVFDLDDTLFPERDYVRSGYRAAAEHLRGRDAGADELAEWLWQRFLAGRADRAFDAMNEHFALGLSGDEIAALVDVYRRHRPAIRPREGAAELLAALRPRRLGLLTDGYLPAQRLKLEATGLAGHFDAVVFTEQLGRECWKPSPAGFREIARRLGAAHRECVYVGDNLAKDFVAPNALGWRTVCLRCGGQVHAASPAPPGGEPDVTISRLADLPGALDA